MDALTLAAELVAKWEGFRPYPYPDPASPLAIATRRLAHRWGTEPAHDVMAGLAPLVRTLDGKPWTIGHGITGENIGPDTEPWSLPVGLANLEGEVQMRLDAVRRRAKADGVSVLRPWQEAALASFLFNVGPGRKDGKDGLFMLKIGRPSTLWRETMAGNFDAAAGQFKHWNKAGGQVMSGLTARRDDERVMFLGFHPLLGTA
jgi:lysozyme